RKACEGIIDALQSLAKSLELFTLLAARQLKSKLSEKAELPQKKPASSFVLEASRALTAAFACYAHSDSAARSAAVKAAGEVTGITAVVMPGNDNTSIEQITAILDILRPATTDERTVALKGCCAAAAGDGYISVEEAELVRLVALILDLPLPPILPGQKM
ncbi:MAG: hypothetical protein D6719_12025, partial [Candidatus Dadabacteria bacterium]